MPNRRQFLAALGSTALAGAVWVPSLSTVFGPASSTLDGDPEDPVIAGLIEAQLRIGEGEALRSEAMRVVNPEWDFMRRTFASLGLLGAMVARPALRSRVLRVVDASLEHTLRTIRERSQLYYLMPYARRAPFLNPEGTSLFVDGELLVLLATREQLVGDGRFADEQGELARRVRANLDASPIGHGESYPDECWAFCNAFAALGLQLDARTSSRDHRTAVARYLASTRMLIEPATGMLTSEYTWSGRGMDGPEGSSIHLAAALLGRIEPTWGRRQYELARTHLLRDALGFGYSREWKGTGVEDVDSGPIVPFFQAGSAASGMAILSASAFDDRERLRQLLASLWACAFPTWRDGALSFAASNPVGDAAMLFGLVQRHLNAGWIA